MKTGKLMCVCVCSSVNLCVLFVVCVWLLVFIRLHVYACLTEDNEQSSMCNRCSSQLELICCYQRAQHSLQHQLRWNPIDLRRKASARLQYVGKRRWTLGLFNCCVGVADGSACPILGRNKANIVIAATQTCLPIYLLSFSGGEEKGWRGVKLGWQWQIKLVTFFLSFSFFFFFCCFVAKPPPAILSLCWGLVFRYREENTRGTFTLISHCSSLHRLSLFLFFSLRLSPSIPSPLYGLLFMWQCGHAPLTQLPDNTGGRRHYRSAVWLTPIKERRKHILLSFLFYSHYELVART